MKLQLTLTIILFSLSKFACATSVATSISEIMVDRSHGEKAFIALKINPSDAGYGVNGSWRFVLDISDGIGKALYTNLLTLYATGKSARFTGSYLCTRVHTGIEELTRIELL